MVHSFYSFERKIQHKTCIERMKLRFLAISETSISVFTRHTAIETSILIPIKKERGEWKSFEKMVSRGSRISSIYTCPDIWQFLFWVRRGKAGNDER
jgi:hypothetical protein